MGKPAKKSYGEYKFEELGHGMCRWEISGQDMEVEASDFRFCGKPVVQDKPYCVDHCKSAYLGKKGRWNDIAEDDASDEDVDDDSEDEDEVADDEEAA